MIISFALYWAAGSFIGPGNKDQSIRLIGGYSYLDAGQYEKQIVFSAKPDKPPRVVIDSRVDDYMIDGNMIYVTRSPRKIFKENGIVKTRISSTCEYWAINTSTNNIERIGPIRTLKCK